ncbi:hypothetical protein F5Y19DRAFT_270994 [Xylariaceae sp. FL1651]|nr:hypothetical protein F5Y19DRAFT_270994 [Xylariaceae sp. FL1651]
MGHGEVQRYIIVAGAWKGLVGLFCVPLLCLHLRPAQIEAAAALVSCITVFLYHSSSCNNHDHGQRGILIHCILLCCCAIQELSLN